MIVAQNFQKVNLLANAASLPNECCKYRRFVTRNNALIDKQTPSLSPISKSPGLSYLHLTAVAATYFATGTSISRSVSGNEQQGWKQL